MPPHHGLGFDNDQSLLPVAPETGKQNPEKTVSAAKLRSFDRLFHNGHLLANRKFPAATFIRRREDFDYLQEPDVFHEIYGHCPMLTNQTFADFLQKYGELAVDLDKDRIWMTQRLFWFTVEFGLIETEEGLRICGAGIASSAGESPYALESQTPERRPFDALAVFRTPYRIDIFQTVYYVIENCNQLYDLVTSDLTPVMDRAKALGSLPATFPSAEAS